jgi:hypothetical protein
MINLQHSQLLTLAEASNLLPGRPSVATLWRWRKKGVRGRILTSVTIGGRVYVTIASLEKFAEVHGQHTLPQMRSPARRERAITRAEQDLAEAGI